MPKVTFLRHGQSVWNRDRRYTGWTDVELSSLGRQQAERAGRLLQQRGFRFDLCFTSVLQRSRETLDIVLGAMGSSSAEIQSSWRLNERHYGALQGVGKDDARQRYDAESMFRWVRSFDTSPPPLPEESYRELLEDPLYAGVEPGELPATESLEDTLARTLPYWRGSIAPRLREGRSILVVAHLNSLRALVKHLENVSRPEIASLSIHTGEPFVIEFDDDLEFARRSYVQLKPGLALKRWARRIRRGRQARTWLKDEVGA